MRQRASQHALAGIDVTFQCGAIGYAAAGDVRLAFEWWPGAGMGGIPLVCLHGLTSHRRAFSALADELSPRVGILSFDLRGRGESDKPDGPYGMATHAADVAAALDALGLDGPLVLAGHSMGAFVVAAYAAKYPERLAGAILLDGGDFRPPPGADPAELMSQTISIFAERLRVEWTSVDALMETFEATPLYAGRVDDAARRYFEFDVSGEPGALRTKACLHGVEADWAEIMTDPSLRENLKRITCPALLVTAPLGLLGVGDPVISDEIRAEMESWIPDLTVSENPDENHHTMITTRRGAAKTARAVEEFLSAHALV